MYNSLCDCCEDFHLYVIAFDDLAFKILKKLNLAKMTVISLVEFESDELLRIKKERTRQEYCWTCSSFAILYCLKRYNLEQCTYVDADLYFYNNPKVLIDEMKNKSVLITPHNYAQEYDQTTTSGKYCVQFVTFNNNSCGLNVLNWWKDACVKWCYARMEDGKFGDQKYLDDWIERFNCVHALENFGGGIAPWNRTKYILDSGLRVRYGDKIYGLCFYHFHDVKFTNARLSKGNFMCYKINRPYFWRIYVPYIIKLIFANKIVSKFSKSINVYKKWNILKILFTTRLIK